MGGLWGIGKTLGIPGKMECQTTTTVQKLYIPVPKVFFCTNHLLFVTTVIPVQKSHQLNAMNNISDSEYDGMYVACSQHSQHI